MVATFLRRWAVMMSAMSETGKLTEPTHYQSYLVRLWRSDMAAPWRILVTYIPTGEQHHFTNLTECMAYIMARSETAVAPTDK